MPYRRHLVCPLLTTHGRILWLLTSGSRQRLDIADQLHLSSVHTGRLLRELSGEGLIQHERLGTQVWWSVAPGLDMAARLATD